MQKYNLEFIKVNETRGALVSNIFVMWPEGSLRAAQIWGPTQKLE